MRAASLIVAAAAALLAVACAASTPEVPPGEAVPTSADTAGAPPAETATAGQRRAAPPPSPPPSDQGATAETAVLAPPPEPEPPALKPAAILGLDEGAVAALLGPPGFTRFDEPAALWQYRNGGCVLDLFLYADGAAYRVRHVEFRRRADAAPLSGDEAERCLTRIRSGNGRGSFGKGGPLAWVPDSLAFA